MAGKVVHFEIPIDDSIFEADASVPVPEGGLGG